MHKDQHAALDPGVCAGVPVFILFGQGLVAKSTPKGLEEHQRLQSFRHCAVHHGQVVDCCGALNAGAGPAEGCCCCSGGL